MAFCSRCGSSIQSTEIRFCTACGAAVESIQVEVQSASESASPFSTGLVNATRLLAALCMFSGIMAIVQFDSKTIVGRTIIVSSVLTSVVGQFFVHQATKKPPPAWASSVLALFWVGLVGVGILWLVNR